MSSKISDKTADVKVTGSSDSDDDDDTSSSSLLSSSAPSEDESDVETVTFSVPLPSQGKGGKPAGLEKESPVNEPRKLEQELNKAVKTEKSGAAASRSSLSPNKPEVAVSGTSKVLSADSGLKKFARTDEPKVTKTTTANTQRSISPKIVVNDVETADAKTDAKSSAETSKKIRDNSPKKTVSETPNADLSHSASPAKNTNHIDRSKSPQKAESKVEIESPKSMKKNASVVSTLGAGQKSPRSSPLGKTSEEIGRGNLKSSPGEKETERSKSPKKNTEERDISREKSPKNTSIVDSKEVLGETSTRNSPKETVPGEVKKKSDKEITKPVEGLIRTEKSPSGNTKTRLETSQEKPETEEAKAKPKKTKTPKQEDGDVKDDDTSTKSRVDKTKIDEISKNADNVSQNKDKTSLLYNGQAQDFNEESKPGSLKCESNSERLDKESANNVGDNVGVRKPKNSELNKSIESENDINNLVLADGAAPLGKNTSKKAESGSDGVGNDTPSSSSSSSSSKGPNDPKTTESTKELVNEDSEFTYRRKSMDDFIKRILAEAREEKLKQQKGVKGESTAAAGGGEEEEDRKTEGYKEQNGGIFNETSGLPPKWSDGAATDKEPSNLDKRLANVEKRRFSDNESVKGGRSKVKEEGEEESSVKKKPLLNDVNDFDMNLEDDLKEINRYLQSRKTTAASRFDYDDDDDGLENESTVSSTAGKQRRWLMTDGGGDQTVQPDTEDTIQTKSQQPRKKLINDFDDDDDDEVLARFKRERDLALPEALFAPRRRDVTDDVIRERTRSVRGLIDRQTDIVQTMKNSSKALEDLEREIRVVRQVSLDRQARIEALDGALNAEFRAFETDHLAACERLNAAADVIATAAPRDDYGGRVRRQGRLPSLESLNEDSFPARRRSVCAPGAGGYYGQTSRSSDLGIDFSDLRPPRQQQRGSEPRGRAEGESDYQPIDPRRRAGSVSRDWAAADPSGGLDDPGLLLAQRPARTRASIATSNPTADYTDSASSDNFLARIRAKYSFLAPSVDNSGYSGSTRSRGSASNYGTGSLSSTPDFKYTRPRSGLEDTTKLRSRDFLTSSPLSYTPSYYSVRDSRSPASSVGLGGTTMDRGRRAQPAVDAFSFDRPAGSGAGSEFHSRFLDKVRGKKAMGEEAPTAAQDRPFKSRFLKGSPAESASSKPDRATEEGGRGGAEAEGGERSEVVE